MVVESSLMTTKFGKDEDVKLDLCLSLGGPFKKTEKSKPTESSTDGQLNGVNATRKKRERNQQQRNGEEEESKRFRTECNGVDLDLSFRNMDNGNGYGSGQIRSHICTSSDVSDPSSSSHQEGGSSDVGVNFDQTKPVKNIQSGTEETAQSTDGSHDAMTMENQERSNSVAIEIRKPAKPRLNGNGSNGSLLPFAQMPCVTSTGNGPDGKTVNGFLYRYSKSEISIICVCHGTSFSPAEFIVHAGGTNVTHPLRHITVVPSTF